VVLISQFIHIVNDINSGILFDFEVSPKNRVIGTYF